MKSVRHSIGQVSLLVAAVLSSLTAISYANPSLESSSFFRNGQTDQTNAFDSPNPSVRWGNRLNAPILISPTPEATATLRMIVAEVTKEPAFERASVNCL